MGGREVCFISRRNIYHSAWEVSEYRFTKMFKLILLRNVEVYGSYQVIKVCVKCLMVGNFIFFISQEFITLYENGDIDSLEIFHTFLCFVLIIWKPSVIKYNLHIIHVQRDRLSIYHVLLFWPWTIIVIIIVISDVALLYNFSSKLGIRIYVFCHLRNIQFLGWTIGPVLVVDGPIECVSWE